MSGVEVLGLISSIIAILDASLATYAAVKSASGLPPSFRDVSLRLPLIRDTLKAAWGSLAQDTQSHEDETSLQAVLEGCKDKVSALDQVFRSVITSDSDSRLERYLKALNTIPKADKVENLAAGILADLQVLAGNFVIKAATREQMRSLIATAREDDVNKLPSLTANNMGSGSQYVHMGNGNQNVSTGSGVQINGSSTGPFYFRID
ncbi:hypothetical protein CTA2_10964 [Colletotrichum tanaceti]|uniref:NACHT-NTPase and P-loop NTPases N-terminal domain-containing protein n=1 Tax=Colletotrichum tanaceti TaxID=1306861 RepID=A0A4U6XCD9_9PEZI|nr:hypothetical protein CTA2_10964 [Colletotrichum tanaceti]TKW53408.1 hypothetical protein CTA1_11307 [Colletotrichum tanaceti]